MPRGAKLGKIRWLNPHYRGQHLTAQSALPGTLLLNNTLYWTPACVILPLPSNIYSCQIFKIPASLLHLHSPLELEHVFLKKMRHNSRLRLGRSNPLNFVG
jgi:hypothetical protein